MPFGASAFPAGTDVCVRDRSAPSHAAHSGSARREVIARTAVDRESKFGALVGAAQSAAPVLRTVDVKLKPSKGLGAAWPTVRCQDCGSKGAADQFGKGANRALALRPPPRPLLLERIDDLETLEIVEAR